MVSCTIGEGEVCWHSTFRVTYVIPDTVMYDNEGVLAQSDPVGSDVTSNLEPVVKNNKDLPKSDLSVMSDIEEVEPHQEPVVYNNEEIQAGHRTVTYDNAEVKPDQGHDYEEISLDSEPTVPDYLDILPAIEPIRYHVGFPPYPGKTKLNILSL